MNESVSDDHDARRRMFPVGDNLKIPLSNIEQRENNIPQSKNNRKLYYRYR